MFAPKLIRFRSPAALLPSRSSDFRPLPPASVNSAPSAFKSPVSPAPHTPSFRSFTSLTSSTSLSQRAKASKLRASNPLSFQPFTNACFPKSFPLNILQIPRGCPHSPPIFPGVRTSVIPWDLRFLCFHTLTHSFAPRKTLSPIVSCSSALFAKNTRGGVCPSS